MNYSLKNNQIGTLCRYSVLCPEGGMAEVHVMIEVEGREESFSEQYSRLQDAVFELESQSVMKGMQLVMRRFFLSDAINQTAIVDDHRPCTTSYIGQSPLDGSKIAAWYYYVGPQAEVKYMVGSTIVSYRDRQYVWTRGQLWSSETSYEQSRNLISDYETLLTSLDATMERNCIRTWFFVKDVDTQYRGLVRARRELFEQMGMNPQTHYIASTGIGGCPAEPSSLVQMDCYAIIPKPKMRYLYAPTHLNRTYEYGVTFERGVALDLDDRRVCYISGTASIDNKGQVVHVGDVRAQTRRMWENVEALLNEGNMTYDDVVQMIVYLRDPADYALVKRLYDERFHDTPRVITLAPVCRPTWLIEMEVIAEK